MFDKDAKHAPSAPCLKIHYAFALALLQEGMAHAGRDTYAGSAELQLRSSRRMRVMSHMLVEKIAKHTHTFTERCFLFSIARAQHQHTAYA